MRIIKSVLICSILIITVNSVKSQKAKSNERLNHLKNKKKLINTDFVYVSRDTLYSFDKKYKNDITINLIKLNKNETVQVSKKKSHNEGEYNLTNSSVTDLLDKQTSYHFEYKGKSKIVIKCFAKHSKKAWNDFATARSSKISEIFIIKGDSLIRKSRRNNTFGKVYILDRNLDNNHKNIIVGNGCL